MIARVVFAIIDDNENQIGEAEYIDIPCVDREGAGIHLDCLAGIILEHYLIGDGDEKDRIPYEMYTT